MKYLYGYAKGKKVNQLDLIKILIDNTIEPIEHTEKVKIKLTNPSLESEYVIWFDYTLFRDIKTILYYEYNLYSQSIFFCSYDDMIVNKCDLCDDNKPHNIDINPSNYKLLCGLDEYDLSDDSSNSSDDSSDKYIRIKSTLKRFNNIFSKKSIIEMYLEIEPQTIEYLNYDDFACDDIIDLIKTIAHDKNIIYSKICNTLSHIIINKSITSDIKIKDEIIKYVNESDLAELCPESATKIALNDHYKIYDKYLEIQDEPIKREKIWRTTTELYDDDVNKITAKIIFQIKDTFSLCECHNISKTNKYPLESENYHEICNEIHYGKCCDICRKTCDDINDFTKRIEYDIKKYIKCDGYDLYHNIYEDDIVKILSDKQMKNICDIVTNQIINERNYLKKYAKIMCHQCQNFGYAFNTDKFYNIMRPIIINYYNILDHFFTHPSRILLEGTHTGILMLDYIKKYIIKFVDIKNDINYFNEFELLYDVLKKCKINDDIYNVIIEHIKQDFFTDNERKKIIKLSLKIKNDHPKIII